MCRNVMAREKALFHGHPVAAVAADSQAIAAEALQADQGRLRGAALGDRRRGRDEARRARSCTTTSSSTASPPTSPARSSTRWATSRPGFKEADVIVERSFKTEAVHQGYIEPHACLVSVTDGKATIWSSSQGQFMVRAMSALLTGMHAERHPRHPGRDRRRLRRQDHRLSRAGGAGAGEQVGPARQDGDERARKCSAPPARPRARSSTVKIGAKKDGTIVAGQGTYWLQAGAFPGSPIRGAAGCAFGPYDIANVHIAGLRRRLQPLQGRGLPRARRADRRLCGRVRAR